MRLKEKSLFLLDMDGTIYHENELIDGARDFFDTLRRQGKKYVFMTNNSSKSANWITFDLPEPHIPSKPTILGKQILLSSKSVSLKCLAIACANRSCDFPSYLSFPHGLLEMKRGYSFSSTIFYVHKLLYKIKKKNIISEIIYLNYMLLLLNIVKRHELKK